MFLEEIFSPDRVYISIAILATLALLLLSIFITITTRRRQSQLLEHCHYRPRKRLMDGTARRCFQLLNDLFGHRFYIIPDVDASSLLRHRTSSEQYRNAAHSFIDDKVIDFVLCNKHTLRPICVVKLPSRDEKQTPGDRPEDLRNFFRSAHIPFIYLPKPQNISSQDIINEFAKVIYETSQL